MEEQGTRGKEKDPDWRPAPGEAAGTSGGSGDEGWGGRGGGQAGGSGARGSGAAAKRPRTSGPVGSGAGGAGPASNSQPQGAAAGGSEGSGAAGACTSAAAAGGAPLGGSVGAGASQRSDRAGRTPTDEELDPWTEKFKAFVQMLNPGAALLLGSRHRLARDMQAYGEAAREDMRQLLVGDGLAGRMSLTFDIWTGENNVAFMGVTAHYVTSDFQLKQAGIDFRELKGSHTGDLIADELEEVLREWGLEKMLFAVTCDNAENNSRAMRLLAGVLDARPGSRPRHPPLLSRWRYFRCMAHVVNLAVQAALKVDEVAEPLKRLRDVANYIGWSTLRTDRFFELQKGYAATRPQGPLGSRRPSGPLRLIVDCLTRWGSTLHMVNRGFELRMPIAMFFDDSYVRMSHHPRHSSISKETKKAWDAIRLTDAHWDDLAELRDFLTPFEQVTLFAEGSLYPTLSAVVPQYNALIDLQEKTQLTPGISPLRSSLITAALSKLEAAEGNSRGATLELGPDRVKALVRARLPEYQAASTTALGDGGEVTSARGAGVHASAGGGAVNASANVSIQSQLFAAWDAMEAEEGEDPQDEVDQYLAEGRQRGGSALEYWRSRETLKGLRAMARDYLGVPASSAASERAFSQSRNIITWQRHRLAAGQVRASMLIKT
ncbi:unnamed protein product [Closterium sp. NIES-64]|nr:unnamed protein product [Closterium sp. NIES-64]